ncbi:MAG: LysR family transcriptional regulator [Bacilli bacterium]|nr:LysR family transcriptional regulator [Bacilli bacterium]
MKDFNLNSFKTFLEVANCKSFLEASNKLFITQPAVSRSISNLEADLGATLFYRANKGIALTPAGEVLVSYLNECKNLLESCGRVLEAMNDSENGKVVIGVQSHIVRNYLMGKIKHFRENHPNIKVILIDLSTNDLIEYLEKRKVDLVIDSSPIDSIYNNLVIEPVKILQTGFIKSSDYNKKIKNLSDLENECIILPIARSSLRKNINNLFKENGLDIEPQLEYGTEELIIDSVRRNMGIGYVVKDAVDYLIDEGKIEYIDLKEQLPTMEINLVYINNFLTNIGEKFIKEEIYEE